MEFLRVTDLYSDPDKNGKQVLLKKNILLKVDIDLDEITRIEEVIGRNNKPHKKKCLIYWSNQQIPILVQHNYKQLQELKERSLANNKHNTVIGFKYINKK